MILAGTLSRIALAQESNRMCDTEPVVLTENEYESVILVDSATFNNPDSKNGSLQISFGQTDECNGVMANITIEGCGKGTLLIKVGLTCLDRLPQQKRLVLWALPPAGRLIKLGQIVNSGHRTDAVIRAEISLARFELLATLEDAETLAPTV